VWPGEALPSECRVEPTGRTNGGSDMPSARITSTMQDDFPLTITTILQHGARVFGRSECVTWQGNGARHTSYREIEQNARRLASALAKLGVGDGDPVATFCWNTQQGSISNHRILSGPPARGSSPTRG